ncbi:MAG TPA: SDR family NAD(P)-dependent oxidoreductase [Mycobacteriales bacterium]|nr:SDR family NAD(P)-dependent oxidoreductase [Mycobacteriales bacterium]
MHPRRSRLLAVALAGAAAAAVRRRATAGLDTSDLTGRTAVVTGGGSGIGRSLVVLLARRGAHVHVVDRDLARAQGVVVEVRAAGGSAVAHAVDVSDAAAVGALADTVFAEGRVDLLFNNAGIGHAGAVVDTTLADWKALVDVNLMGVVHGLHAFLPRLVAQDGQAHVVNTASMAGLFPSPGLVPYSTTKAAVVGLSEAVDREVVRDGVRVHALCPGIIATDIIRTSTMRGPWADKQAVVEQMYATRGTSPDVVARQALDAVARGRTVIPTPRHQVVPPWLVKRASPSAGAALAGAMARVVSR